MAAFPGGHGNGLELCCVGLDELKDRPKLYPKTHEAQGVWGEDSK